MSLPPFERLRRLADLALEAAVRELPAEIQAVASEVPVTYLPYPTEEIIADGLDPDILGLFLGGERGNDGYTNPIPVQIILFLENIYGYAEEEGLNYEEEVQRTYLHELGHYLGWDEDDLAQRDLD